MSKQSKITNLIAIPLLASAVFLASPAFAAGPMRVPGSMTGDVSTNVRSSEKKRGITGTVSSINGSTISLLGTDNVGYTVDASHATIMKASAEPNVNPSIVQVAEIKVGDVIV